MNTNQTNYGTNHTKNPKAGLAHGLILVALGLGFPAEAATIRVPQDQLRGLQKP